MGWQDLDEQLFDALKVGKHQEVESLLKAGGNANAVNQLGIPALFYAIEGHDEQGRLYRIYDRQMVELLLAHGAKVNTKDAEGNTLLMHIASQPYFDVGLLKTLLHFNANVNAKNDRGETALMLAAQESGADDVVKSLLEAGVNPNMQDASGNTALMHAAGWRGNYKAVEWLLKYDADMFIHNEKGETALSRAQDRHYDDIVKLLLEWEKYKLDEAMNIDNKGNNFTYW